MLQLKNIHRSVGNNHIIQGIDLTLHSHKAIGLVGPNGCGKTSLLNIINGFNMPSSGQITFDHQTITKKDVVDRAQLGIGRVFQSYGVVRELSLYDNLALAFASQISWYRRFLPLSMVLSEDQKSKINTILHEIGLYDKRMDKAGNCSGGQMRLLEIARLYLQDTKLFLLDEPTAGVSPKLKETVIKLIKKIIDTGSMVIVVEHDFKFLTQFVDEFYVLDAGQVIMHGSAAEIIDSPTIKEIYFG